MKTIILTCHSEFESAKKLGYKETFEYLPGYVEDYNNSLIIRWGNGVGYHTKCGAPMEFPNVITNYKDIELNCAKNKASKKLSEVVLTPKLWTDTVPKNKWAVFRPTSHAGGKDFQVKKGPFKIDGSHYATEFIKSDKEIRVWYCNGRTICARRVTKNQKRLNEKFKCRSLWSYQFWKKTPKKLHKQVLKAAKQLNFQYGAFDILIGKKGKYYFLENNTAPSLDHSKVIKFYQSGLKAIVKRKMKQIAKNPPLETRFKIVSFNAGVEALKSLIPKKTIVTPTVIPNGNNTILKPAQPQKHGFFSRFFLGNTSLTPVS